MYMHVTIIILKTNDCTVHNMQLSAKNNSINKLTTMRMMGTMPKFLKYGAMIAIVHVLGISVEFLKFSPVVCLLQSALECVRIECCKNKTKVIKKQI